MRWLGGLASAEPSELVAGFCRSNHVPEKLRLCLAARDHDLTLDVWHLGELNELRGEQVLCAFVVLIAMVES